MIQLRCSEKQFMRIRRFSDVFLTKLHIYMDFQSLNFHFVNFEWVFLRFKRVWNILNQYVKVLAET